MRPEKELMVEEIYRQVESSRSLLVTSYVGLKAQELEEFRNILRQVSSDYMIVKNTLLSKAVAKANLPSVDEHLVGSTGVVFGGGDDVTLAKRVMQFIKDHELLKLKVGILEKNILSKEQVAHLATLPSREVLIAQVVGTLKAPLAGLVGVLSAIPRAAVIALNAIREKKEKEAAAIAVPAAVESPAASEPPPVPETPPVS